MSDTKHNKLMKYSRIGNIIYLNNSNGNKMSSLGKQNTVDNYMPYGKDDFISDDVLFNMYLQAIELQGLDTDIINKNKSKITKLLRVIEEADEDSYEYKEANKRIAILTLEKPNFFKQVFNLT